MGIASTVSAVPDVPRKEWAGTFVTLEGTDGVGKSTQCDLLCHALKARGIEVVRLREPGGTALGEKIRAILLDGDDAIDAMSELLLFEAARAQLVSTVIEPALERGAFVVSDRFYDSTTAYQGYGRNLGEGAVESANRLACRGVEPDRTLLFDMDVHDALARAAHDGPDRIEHEGDDFQDLVRAGFSAVAARNPERVRTIDARGDRALVWSRVRDALADLVDLPLDPVGSAR